MPASASATGLQFLPQRLGRLLVMGQGRCHNARLLPNVRVHRRPIRDPLSIEAAWFAEDCPQPVLLPHGVTALDIARWYAHDLANFLPTPSYCESLATYLPVWRLPVPARWCFVPRSVEEAAMLCYRSAIREALVRGRGSTGGHEIAAVLEEWAAAAPFSDSRLDGVWARVLIDRTLEIRDRAERSAADPDACPRDQYRVIGAVPHTRRLPPQIQELAVLKEPPWQPLEWPGGGDRLLDVYLRHEGARPTHALRHFV